MPYVTSVEQIGIEKGERKGLLEGIELGLKLKFGAEGLRLLPELRQLQDVDKLRAVLQALETAISPEELRPLCS